MAAAEAPAGGGPPASRPEALRLLAKAASPILQGGESRVCLAGPPGSGKSDLLREFLPELHRAAAERGLDLPIYFVDGRPLGTAYLLLAALVRLAGGGAPSTGWSWERLAEAWCARVRGPAVVAIDHADEASGAEGLLRLLARHSPAPLGLVASARSGSALARKWGVAVPVSGPAGFPPPPSGSGGTAPGHPPVPSLGYSPSPLREEGPCLAGPEERLPEGSHPGASRPDVPDVPRGAPIRARPSGVAPETLHPPAGPAQTLRSTGKPRTDAPLPPQTGPAQTLLPPPQAGPVSPPAGPAPLGPAPFPGNVAGGVPRRGHQGGGSPSDPLCRSGARIGGEESIAQLLSRIRLLDDAPRLLLALLARGGVPLAWGGKEDIAEPVEGAGPVTTGRLWLAYRRAAPEEGLRPLTLRRVSGLLRELEEAGLVSAPVLSRGRGGRTKWAILTEGAREALAENREIPGAGPNAATGGGNGGPESRLPGEAGAGSVSSAGSGNLSPRFAEGGPKTSSGKGG